MNPTERPSALTHIEELALEVQSSLPVALAITALDRYAQVNKLDSEWVDQTAEAMRTMSPKQLKKLRKSLSAAAMLSELMPDLTPVVQLPDAEEISVANEPLVAAESQAADSVEHAGGVESDISESGMQWVLKLIPDYEFEGMTARKIANDLYRRMGQPKTRAFGGKKIDPLERMRQRIRGATTSEIAAASDASPQSVDMWFRNFVNARFKEADSTDADVDPADTTSEDVNEERSEDILYESLAGANFTRDEIAAVESIIGMIDSLPTNIAQEATTQARNRLQSLLITNIDKLDNELDASVISGLRMLTTTAFGVKTVRDVYHKIHGKNNSVTHEDVVTLLQNGILKLATQEETNTSES